jgi:hypothetical protein
MVDVPAGVGCDLQQGLGWIDGISLFGEGEHRSIVNGIAEDGVGRGAVDAAERFGLAFVGWNVDDVFGDEAIFDADFCSHDAFSRNTEAGYAFFHNPVVGGTDGPDFRAAVVKSFDERQHFRKDIFLDLQAEVFASCLADFVFGVAFVDLEHFRADGVFIHFAAEVAAMARVEPVAIGAGDEAAFHGPAHEAGSGVAAPERAVAIEDGDFGIEVEDRLREGCCGEWRDGERRYGLCGHSCNAPLSFYFAALVGSGA